MNNFLEKDPNDWENQRAQIEIQKRTEENKRAEIENQRTQIEIQKRAEENQRTQIEIEKRAEDRQLLKAQREEEEVEVLFITENNLTPTSNRVSRKLFDSWQRKNFVLQAFDYSNGGVNVRSFFNFEDIKPLSVCELVQRKSEFGGYAEIEGTVQTINCVRSIVNGEVTIPDFNHDVPAIVKFEPKFTKPDDLDVGALGFNFPINPDAEIIAGTIWILLESKHSCTNADIAKFERKIEYLMAHRHESWVRRGHPTPTHIIGVVNSIGPYSKTVVPKSKIVRLIRSGIPNEEV